MSERIGVPEAIGGYLEHLEITDDARQGPSSTLTYRGSEQECAVWRSRFLLFGATRISRSPTGDGEWKVTAEFPWNQSDRGGGPTEELPTDVMELDTGISQQDWTQSPVLMGHWARIGCNAGITAVIYGIIADVVRDYQSGEIKAELDDITLDTIKTKEEVAFYRLLARLNDNDGTFLHFNISDMGFPWAIFRMVCFRGTTSFMEFHTTFRRTITAGSPMQVQASFQGVGKIWTTEEVAVFEGIPEMGWFTLPAGMQWHKGQPTVRKVFRQKTELNYTYTGIASASALLYEKHGSAVLLDEDEIRS